jgi:hypothetical protein
MLLSETQLREIADLLLCGELCFVHKANGTIVHFPKEVDLFMDEEDPWQDIKDNIDQDLDHYIKFEPMDSTQSFEVMREFVALVESDSLRQQLTQALNRVKPFANFKYIIDNSGEYRQQWFDFRLEQNVLWVEEQLRTKM